MITNTASIHKLRYRLLASALKNRDGDILASIPVEAFPKEGALTDILKKAKDAQISTGVVPDREVLETAVKLEVPKDEAVVVESVFNKLYDTEPYDKKELKGAKQVILELALFEQTRAKVSDIASSLENADLNKLKTTIGELARDLNTTGKIPKDISETSYSPTSIVKLDSWVPEHRAQGLSLSGVTLIGGMSGGGKSIYLLQQALYSYEAGENVAVINLELGHDEVLARLYSLQTGTDFSSVYGNADPDVTKAVNDWKDSYFNRSNSFKIIAGVSYNFTELSEVITVLSSMHETKLVCVDYLNLVENDSGGDDWRGLAKSVKQLHRISQNEGCVILTPTQINTGDIKEQSNSELQITPRGSKELLFSASLFLCLYSTQDEFSEGVIRLFTVKARNARRSAVVLEHDFAHMCFKPTGVVIT